MRLLSSVRGWIGRPFDTALDRPLAVVAVFGTLTGAVMYFLGLSPPAGCPSLPVSLIRVEVTFDAAKFAALLAAEGAGCRGYAIAGLGWLDVLFAILYPFLLAAIGVWAMRWRYRRPDGKDVDYDEKPETWRRRLLTVAPFIAGACDILEDLFLSIAAHRIGHNSWVLQLLVIVGSIFSSIKWILLSLWLVGVIAEWLAGPRGRVLRLTRFSTLAVLLGALPLLAVPQGQDILQRLGEAHRHPYVRVWFGVLAMVFAATVVWYVSRRLLQRGFEADERWTTKEGLRKWLEDFAVNIPRIQGTAMIVLGGLAFARTGERPLLFAGVAIFGFAFAAWLESRAQKKAVSEATQGSSALETDQPASARKALRNDGAKPRVIAAVVSSIVGAVLLLWPSHDAGLLDDTMATFALRMAATGCVIAAWVFFLFVRYRRTVMATRRTGTARQLGATARAAYRFDGSVSKNARAPERLQLQLSRSVWLALAASFVVLLTFMLRPVPVARFIGPLWVLALFAANTVLFGSFAVYIYERFGIPVVRIAIGFAFLFGLWNENHSIRLLDPIVKEPRAALTVRLDSFVKARAAKDEPIILVAAAGGGLRAAYWTATTLSAIQDGNPAFANHVFVMSGVSGGSLGVALFDALVHDGGAHIDQLPCATERDSTGPIKLPGPYSRCSRRFLRDDFLAPVLAKMVAPDLAQRFLPVPVSAADRSTALEESWEESYDKTTAQHTFGNGVVAFAKDTTVPLLLLNATHVETGKRYMAGTVTSDSVLLDTRDVLTQLQSDIRLSSAVHNSARFTFVSPAGHLDRGDSLERGRVVDGGYFENSGLVTLREVYEKIREKNESVRVVAVYLCNDPVACRDEPDTTEHTDGSGQAQAQSQTAARDALAKAIDDSVSRTHNSWANELLAPVRAVLDARDARGELALAQMRHDLDSNFIQLNVCGQLTRGDSSERAKRAHDRVVSPPLGWSLSRLASNWMDASMLDAAKDSATGPCPAHNRQQIARLREMR